MTNPSLAVAVPAAQGTVSVAILNGNSLSGPIDLAGGRLARIVLPSALDGTTVTFRTSYDGATFGNLYDESGNEVAYIVAASRSVRVPLVDWLGVAWLEIRTGTSGAPVVQSADRALTLVMVL
ncbi:hypothetical protein EYW49_22010 [Siculibacillus lacustris]|uniref:Uncharacterized protein n=1 Tax=Siculibacillus lacustris TaxID=1549641 RepID=A0A4V2KSF7_9HYPH|nr:hypothetical protein [Siculibacillus lacustris]TBW32616.1 hypothetical protein EYW49_22010 [Siculibacillus lacustris]